MRENEAMSAETPPSSDVLDLPTDAEGPLGHLLRALRLERTGPNTFVGPTLPTIQQRVYGGQVLAQAIIAAADTVPAAGEGARSPHSVHGYFLRPGSLDHPVEFAVERLHDGRSFSTRRTHALQQGTPILSMISSYQVDQPGRDHGSVAPAAPAPESVPSALETFEQVDHPAAQFMVRTAPFEIRHVGGDLYLDTGEERTDQQLLWIRARSELPAGLSQVHHRALLAYACDQVMLEPVLRRHGISWRTRGMSLASLDHAMWWHRPVNVGQWLLFAQESPSAHGGRGLGTARVFTEDGTHVATLAQEGMVRVPEDAGS